MRKNDNLILASSQWLDGKLQGKSVKFNQLVQNGNFADTTGWRTENATAPFVFKDANDNTLATYSRTSKVDLGTLNYTMIITGAGLRKFYAGISTAKPSGVNEKGNIYCSKYKNIASNVQYYGNIGVSGDTISLDNSKNFGIILADQTITSATEVKSLLSGIYLEYEPATQLELRSAGTVKDTLSNCDGKMVRKVGTRAYQSGDENNPNYLTDGTTTNYPLATPTTETKGTIAIPKLATKCTDANGMEIDIERNN